MIKCVCQVNFFSEMLVSTKDQYVKKQLNMRDSTDPETHENIFILVKLFSGARGSKQRESIEVRLHRLEVVKRNFNVPPLMCNEQLYTW